MIQPATLKFLKDLKKNNNKEWFELHRKKYESAKTDILSFTETLISATGKIDKTIAALSAKSCTFRINRDVRFSKNKAPYKSNMAVYLNKDGKKGKGAGYYLHIQPGGSFAAAGIWMPETAVLAAIRQEIDYHFPEWKKLVSSSTFKKYFPDGPDKSESLVRPPKGYTPENPAIDYLKMKSFIVMKKFTDQEVLAKGFTAQTVKTFQAAKPMIDFLNRASD